MHNAADDPTIVRPLDAPNIRRQARFDPLPLLIAQPKQVSAHDPNPLPKTNQDRIVNGKLMSSDPSTMKCGLSFRLEGRTLHPPERFGDIIAQPDPWRANMAHIDADAARE